MNPREQRGVVIAALCKLTQTDGRWVVPSQTGGDKRYVVDATAGTCTCPDHAETGFKCKHVYAVEFTMKRETMADGTVTETKSITFTEKKKYTQDLEPRYNAAQAVEKDRLQELLAELAPRRCRARRARPRAGKPHVYRDCLFAMAFKVYCTLSTRRTDSDLREAHRRGCTSKSIPGLKVAQFMENPAFTPILKRADRRQRAAAAGQSRRTSPLTPAGSAPAEVRAVVRPRSTASPAAGAVWVKVHSGVRGEDERRHGGSDSRQGRGRLAAVHARWSRRRPGTSPSAKCPPTRRTRPWRTSSRSPGSAGPPSCRSRRTRRAGWAGSSAKMFHYFQFKQEEYMAHYHKRSNVESTFSMIKRKFGDSVRSQTDAAMVNEVLCKVLCHNLCVLNRRNTNWASSRCSGRMQGGRVRADRHPVPDAGVICLPGGGRRGPMSVSEVCPCPSPSAARTARPSIR